MKLQGLLTAQIDGVLGHMTALAAMVREMEADGWTYDELEAVDFGINAVRRDLGACLATIGGPLKAMRKERGMRVR